MTLMFSLQLLALLVAAASLLLVHAWLGAVLPAATLLVYDLVWGGFLAWWALSIAIMRLRRAVQPDTAEGWYDHTLAVFWLGNVATVISFWIALPHGSEAMRLLVAMMCAAPVTVEIIGTIRPPAAGPRDLWSTLAPLGIPAGLMVWFAGSHDEFAVPVIFFMAAFLGGLLLLRELVQGMVTDTWAAKRAAEAARDGRTRFLAAASHDLGQPLQAARLFFDQALAAEPGPARSRAARGVHWAFDATEQLLGQMLEHLRLEAGQVAARAVAMPVGPLLAELAERHEPAARLAGLEIAVVPSRLAVIGDRALIDRALGNLVGNAIRHAGAGRLLIGARRCGGRVRIWVIDDGVGVPAADWSQLFDDHFQGSNHGDAIRGGFGLGLASTRRLAELMGGAAGHERRWRRGAAFWLDLPAA